VSPGRVARLQGWQFADTDAVTGSAWKAASRKPVPGRAGNVANPPLG
jgi:hypothetical protein